MCLPPKMSYCISALKFGTNWAAMPILQEFLALPFVARFQKSPYALSEHCMCLIFFVKGKVLCFSVLFEDDRTTRLLIYRLDMCFVILFLEMNFFSYIGLIKDLSFGCGNQLVLNIIFTVNDTIIFAVYSCTGVFTPSRYTSSSSPSPSTLGINP